MSLRISPPLSRRRIGQLLLAAGLLTSLPRLAQASAEEAARFIRTVGDDTVRILVRAGSSPQERVAGISAILDKAADVPLIGRLVLGRHWRAVSEAERAEYTKLFRGYALNSLAQRFSNYSGGERIEVTGSKAVDERDSVVATQIFIPGRPQAINVDWRVRKGADGSMAIIDVVAEGVSMLITNRASVDEIVGRSGMSGLLAEMRGWAGAMAG